SSPLSCLSCFSHRAHLVLLSFPTRRSSDLNPGVAADNHIAALVQNTARFTDVARTLPRIHAPGERFQYKTIESARPARGFGATRSEEHTSELQSRENLVCRLLLETKKESTY